MTCDEMDKEYQQLFAAESNIGRLPNGGTNRMALTEDDDEQRRWFIGRLQASGARIVVDQVGNIFGLFEWNNDNVYVIAGSHLDSQENGGLFDGAYGVIAALAAAAQIQRSVRVGAVHPHFNLAIVAWTNEEGARFEPSIMGSRVFTGALSYDDIADSVDEHGVRFGDEIEARGWKGSGDWHPQVQSYVEIHVEQGVHLKEASCDIGIVTGNWAAVKIDMKVEGEQSHTGATEMSRRKDALYGASLVVCEARELADLYPDDAVHTSVTKMRTFPHSPNIVTSLCTFHVEIRSEYYETAREAEISFMNRCEELSRRGNVSIAATHVERRDSMRYWEPGLGIAHQVAQEEGLSCMQMKTISGHDSVAMNAICPTIMLFAPSNGGYAHSPRESTDQDAQIKGVHELFGVICKLLQTG